MAYILIADDDDLVAEMASEVLLDAGYACGYVTSGEEALVVMETKRPDLLLLDQNMPGISGVSLLRTIRGSQKFYDLAVVMFTAMQSEEDEDRARYAGAQDYIRKPLHAARLTERVERVLAKRGRQGMDLRTRMARDAGLLQDERVPIRRWI